MKEKIIIKISPEDAQKAQVKGLKEMSREHAKLGRSLRSQIIPNKKGGGGVEARKYPKHMQLEDLDEEELEEIRAKLKEESEEEII